MFKKAADGARFLRMCEFHAHERIWHVVGS